MWRNLASNMLTLLVVALIAVAGVIGWGQSQYVAQGPLERAICLQVPQGGSMTGVANDLAAQGAISNATIYRLGADYTGKAPALKAGSFLIEPGTSMQEIVSQVTGDGRSTCGTEILYIIAVNGQEKRVRELDPDTQEFEVTAAFDPKADADVPEAYTAALEDVATQYRLVVVEGVTSWQVIEGLNATEILTGEVSVVPPEGSLAPREFAVRPGDDRSELVAEMTVQQEQWLAAAWEARSESAAVETPEEALILASIIEKETALAEERPLVSSVFTNRLKQGIKLQTDPTVIYGVTEGKSVLGRGLRRSELRAETPWNTYVIDGLPPTPIANPGQASIEAALNPDESDYIFFVAKTLDPRDGHNFAVTLDEHNENVAAYRALERAAE
ncbi:MAG: endolytic transglycosylase MltG [Pseudomonadota bacterium]